LGRVQLGLHGILYTIHISINVLDIYLNKIYINRSKERGQKAKAHLSRLKV